MDPRLRGDDKPENPALRGDDKPENPACAGMTKSKTGGYLFCRDFGETFCQRFKARRADKPYAGVREPPERERQELFEA